MTGLLIFVARAHGKVIWVDSALPERSVPPYMETLNAAGAEITVHRWSRKDPPPTNHGMTAITRAPTWHLEETYTL